MKRVCILILGITILSTIAVANEVDSIYRAGLDEFRNGSYETAYSKFQTAANNGHAAAQYNLALCYKSGKGIAQNDSVALHWFNLAAEQGHLSAQFNVGYCYYTGKGTDKDMDTAAIWFKKASDQGDAFAKKLYNRCVKLTEKKAQENTLASSTNSLPKVTSNTTPTIPGIKDTIPSVVEQKTLPAPVLATTDTPATKMPANSIDIPKKKDYTTPSIGIIPFDGYPYFSEEEIDLYYLIKSDLPISEFAIMLDGVKIDNSSIDTEHRKVRLKLPRKDCNILMLAQNDEGWSAPTMVELKWDNSAVYRPDLHVLAIGIDNYENLSGLQFAVKDMTDFVNAVEQKINKPYKNIYIDVLSNAQADKQSIEEHLETLASNVEDNDFTFIYFAGHGKKDNHDRFYLAPINADERKIMSTCISQEQFNMYIDNIPGKVIAFIDACYSGSLLRSGSTMDDVIEQMNFARPGRYIYVSSSSDIVAIEKPELGNGAFTKALVEAINGRATNGGPLTTVTLMEYIKKRMKELLNGTTTRPAFDGWNEPFPLFTH